MKPAPARGRHRAAEHEAARLGGDHVVGLALARVVGQRVDRCAQRLRVEEQRRDVLEDDPRLGEVGDVAGCSRRGRSV